MTQLGLDVPSVIWLRYSTASTPPGGCPWKARLRGEIIEARIWAGLHFRAADVQAAELRRNVAEFMEGNYFQPLD